MGAFVVIPYTTGHATLLIGGVLINFSHSLDGKGVITITVGDPWEVITEKLSSNELLVRRKEALRLAADGSSNSVIECGAECEAALQFAIKSGKNRLEALEDFRDCVRSCYGAGPA
jgi:hypothetical protein